MTVGTSTAQIHAQPTYVISVAAELAGMHPQTLRQYDRLGLVTPARAKGRGRRYSSEDIQLLRIIQKMSHEGVNLEGIKRIIALERQVNKLRAERDELCNRVDEFEERNHRVFAASRTGVVSPIRQGQRPWVDPGEAHSGGALIPWSGWNASHLVATLEVMDALRGSRHPRYRRALEAGPSFSSRTDRDTESGIRVIDL